MAERTGKCTNYTTCTLAYRNQPIPVAGDLVCPECGKPLQELKSKAAPGSVPLVKQKWFLYGAPALLLIVFIGILASQSGDVPAPPADTASPTPPPAEMPIATPPPMPDPGPATPPATPAPIASPVATPSPMPPTTPEPAEPVGSVITPEKIDINPATKENSAIKAEVLKRIDQIPGLTERERDALYSQVERARSMGKLITIPFEAGKSTLAPKAIDELQAILRNPEVAKLTGDPTVVFVILGYADKRGDQKKNLAVSIERAESAVRVLREKCGLQSLMHSVGMGGSDFFEQGDLARNRVAEIWAVLP